MVTVTILVGCATSAAPGDEDSSCDQTDPDSQKVLMDSNRYSFLLRSGGPWSQLSVDGDSVTVSVCDGTGYPYAQHTCMYLAIP